MANKYDFGETVSIQAVETNHRHNSVNSCCCVYVAFTSFRNTYTLYFFSLKLNNSPLTYALGRGKMGKRKILDTINVKREYTVPPETRRNEDETREILSCPGLVQ